MSVHLRRLAHCRQLLLCQTHAQHSASRHCCSHAPYLPSHLPRLPLHTPSLSTTHCHSYSTQSTPQDLRRCWKCDRELDKGSRRDGSRVHFFCPCDKRVVLPPSTAHTYFEIMDWYALSASHSLIGHPASLSFSPPFSLSLSSHPLSVLPPTG